MGKYYHIDEGVSRTHKKIPHLIAGLFIVVLIASVVQPLFHKLTKPGSPLSKSAVQQSLSGTATAATPQMAAAIPWPGYGYSAYAVPNENLFAASTPKPEAVPIASLAKVITVLTVLKHKPLQPGSQGPTITLSDADVALVSMYAQKSGVVVPVEAGEQITEYQALQATLLMSANNMADSLATWAFGSVDAYTVEANKMVKELGLNDTVITDASGFSPKTVSTPENMTALGYQYMKNPVLRDIATQQTAKVPVAGIIKNYNSFANEDDVIGIKIGNTDEAGKCYLVAEIRNQGKSTEEVSVAVVLGAEDLHVAAKDARAILKAGNTGHDSIAQKP